MFTVEQIQQAHSKVRKGSDFPAYIKNIKAIGVTHYETYVRDRHTVYFGCNGFKISSSPEPDVLLISDTSNVKQFKNSLFAHQLGKTDYSKFCKDCAITGIEKWMVSVQEMTCTYFDKAGTEILAEIIAR